MITTLVIVLSIIIGFLIGSASVFALFFFNG